MFMYVCVCVCVCVCDCVCVYANVAVCQRVYNWTAGWCSGDVMLVLRWRCGGVTGAGMRRLGPVIRVSCLSLLHTAIMIVMFIITSLCHHDGVIMV
jgi:hypothetical protein